MNTGSTQSATISAVCEMTQDKAEIIADILRRGFRDVAERFDFNPERCPTFPAHCQKEWISKEAGAGTRFLIEYKHYDHLPFTVVYMCKEASHG